MATVDPEKYRRVKFVDDLSPITADILNDNQALLFDSFENLRLEVSDSGNRITLTVDEDGYDHSSSGTNEFGMIVAAGRIRYLSDGNPPEYDASGESAGDYYIQVDPGNDTGKYTNSNLDTLDLKLSGKGTPDNERNIGVTHWNGTRFENTETIAGASMRSRQYNAFTFESIDGNSTPLTIDGINGNKPNLVVDAEVTFKLHDDPDLAAEGHIMVDTAKGGIKTELIVAPDPNSTDPHAPSDPTVVIGHNVHIPGDITVDGDLIFDTHELGTVGASRWNDLLSANETLPWELSDCAFEHLLPNPSHAPLNVYPLGTIIELATSHYFKVDEVSTWPTGWLLMDNTLRWDMTDENTVYWLTPLIEFLDGVGSVPADWWSLPHGTLTNGAYERFIFLGPMSYMTMDADTSEIHVDTEAQERGREWTNIKWL